MNHLSNFDRDFDRAFRRIAGLWVVGVLFALAFWAAVIFVALHFLAKVW